MSQFRLRPEQAQVVDRYQYGYAAIAAVPGAGKTTTLSALAATLIERIGPRQRVVIVTYQNAAVANFQRAVAQRLRERGLPERGFMVRTLHSLATEVLASVRHRAGLDVVAQIIDERDADRLLEDVLAEMVQLHSEMLRDLIIDPEHPDARRWPRDEPWLLKEVVKTALTEIRRIEPDIEAFAARCQGYGRWLPFALEASLRYQRALRERGFLDYDGIIERAVAALERDPALCARLRARWPFLLEDEAQDSNPLLERMLTLIAGDSGNLVRVGDPNQSILTTFTASSVEGFLRWLDSEHIEQFQLAGSSRSTEAILELANRFVERVRADFPIEEARIGALRQQSIAPVYVAGVLHNPPVPLQPSLGIQTRTFKRTEDEREEVLGMALRYLRKYPDRTAAVLVGSKQSGYEYAAEAAEEGFPDEKMIRLLGGKDGRQVGLIDRLLPILDYLEIPDRVDKLVAILEAWSGHGPADRVAVAVRSHATSYALGLSDLLYPPSGRPVAAEIPLPDDLDDEEEKTLSRLRSVPGWLHVRMAQPHELLAFIGSTAGLDDEERSLFDAIVVTVSTAPPDPKISRLQHLRMLLRDLKTRHRRLRGTYEDHEIRIDPGTLTISTRHQAKGLEWDIVFAVGCDDFWFKGSTGSPRRYQRGYLGPFDPLLVVRAEIAAVSAGEFGYPDDDELARVTYVQDCDEVSEGLRVMYVTLTRARHGLWLSWHQDGTQGMNRATRTMSPIFPLLERLVEEVREGRMSAAAD